VSRFTVVDERYSDLVVADAVEVLAETVDASGHQPALWSHDVDGARVVYDALGHDRRSLDHDAHRRLIRAAASWAAPD
jgi:hypothetical protein